MPPFFNFQFHKLTLAIKMPKRGIYNAKVGFYNTKKVTNLGVNFFTKPNQATAAKLFFPNWLHAVWWLTQPWWLSGLIHL